VEWGRLIVRIDVIRTGNCPITNVPARRHLKGVSKLIHVVFWSASSVIGVAHVANHAGQTKQLAAKMASKPARVIFFPIVQILGADKANNVLTNNGLNLRATGRKRGPSTRLWSKPWSRGRQRAALACFKIHNVICRLFRDQRQGRILGFAPDGEIKTKTCRSWLGYRRWIGKPNHRGPLFYSIFNWCWNVRVSTQDCVGNLIMLHHFVHHFDQTCACCTLSVAGLIPITASPLAFSSKPLGITGPRFRFKIVGLVIGL